MKKVIKTMMMMLVASAFVLTSCKDTEDPADVVLTINPSKTSGVHFVEDTLNIVVNGQGNSDNKLKNLKITKAPEGKPTVTILNEKLSGTDKIYNLKDTFEFSEVGKITYTITLEGEENTQTITYVASVRAVNPLDVQSGNIELRSQQQSADHFRQLTDPFSAYGKDVTEDQWSEDVDLVYYYGTTNKHTLCSPTNTTMQTQIFSGLNNLFTGSRATGFYRVPEGDKALYNKIVLEDDDRTLAVYAEGKTYSDDIKTLVNGDVILFKTKEGVLGMIRVQSLTGSASTDAVFQFQLFAQSL